MAVHQVHKTLTLCLVVQKVAECHNQGLLCEAKHVYHSMVQISINMSRSCLPQSIGHIVDCISHVGHEQHLILTKASPLPLSIHYKVVRLSGLAALPMVSLLIPQLLVPKCALHLACCSVSDVAAHPQGLI